MTINEYSFLIFLGALAFMIFALVLALKLRVKIPGGKIGKQWHLLFTLILLFSGGYIAVPFLDNLSPEMLKLAVSISFLFGAIYVVVTILIIKKSYLSCWIKARR